MAMKTFVISASLIIARQHNKVYKNIAFDYELLCLTRSQKGKSFAGQLVFPGGARSEADNNFDAWKTVFSQLEEKSMFDKNSMSNDTVHKLNAIRETFEETGILLCKPAASWNSKGELLTATAHDLGNDRKTWQSLVHKDASKLADLCLKFKLVPDLGALLRLNSWCTPAKLLQDVHGKKRFDNTFYFACVDSNPEVTVDISEIDRHQWSVPVEPLDDFREGKLTMMPPQQYNLTMLASFPRIADLLAFVKQHQSCAVCSSPWLPQMVKCSDGIILAFPGDELYQAGQDVNSTGTSVDKSMEDTRKNSVRVNRVESKDGRNLKLCANFNIHGLDKTVFEAA